MNVLPLPLTRDIVLIGGGHTHALVLRKWEMHPLPGARLTLITPGPVAPYSGMLPGHVAGHYPREALDIDLVRLARFAGARLILGAATGIDRQAGFVNVPGRPPVGYDICSVDIGITSDMPAIPGFADHAIPAKPLGPFAEAWARYLAGSGPARAVVIGGGVAGTELAMAMAHALAERGRDAQVTVLEKDKALSAIRPASAARIRARLAALDIDLREGVDIDGIDAEQVRLTGGMAIPSDFTVGAAGARPYDWIEQTGLDLTDGFITVGPTLQTSDPDIFAAGDCAHMAHAPRPKAGVYAVRQAPVLLHNLQERASGGRMRRYRPQDNYLKLISLGDRSALGERFGLPLVGAFMWRWKDRIDRTFMDKFRDLPVMPAPDLPKRRTEGMVAALGPTPMCGGCGAKVGRAALDAVLAAPPQARDDIEILPGDDAAILRVGGQRLAITTDHLRALTEDPVVMTRIAVNHALGDIWAMAGQPTAATVTLILPRLAPDLRDRTLAEIMTTARAGMRAAGAEIVGGHTSVGAELTIGFTVTGRVDRPVTLAGGQADDALILTKPLGSGVIMAAEMRGLADGALVAEALSVMQQSQADAARILSDAHAMTDVTGFGLAGHLQGICMASGVGAALDLAAIPLIEGAAALGAIGIRSSLYPENRALVPDLPETGGADILFDPQTAGGLLAAVSRDVADDLVTQLRSAGYEAARIGLLTAGPPHLRLA